MNLTEAQHKLSSDISQLYETYQLISKNKNQFNELDVALLQQQLLHIYHSLLKVQSQLALLPVPEENVIRLPEPSQIPGPVAEEQVQPEPPKPEAVIEQPAVPVVIEPEPEVVAEVLAPVEEIPVAEAEPEIVPEPTLDDLERLMEEQEKREEEQLSLLAPEPVKPVIPVVQADPVVPVVSEATISLLDKLTASMRTPDIHEKISRENQSLKQAINLNKKIAFVNNLFNENTVEYAKAIEKLNAATGAHEALRYFSELKHQYSWNNENPLVKDLEQLIERRFS